MSKANSLPLFNGWRIAAWGSLLALLVLPALAMQLTPEVDWTSGDFIFAAILLGFLGAVVELAVRFGRPGVFRQGYMLAGFTAFLTVWSNAAVGIIGDDNAVNSSFFAMVAAALVTGLIFQFRPTFMRRMSIMLAGGQYAVGIAALWLMPGHAVEWGVLTFFALLWLAVAWYFYRPGSARRG